MAVIDYNITKKFIENKLSAGGAILNAMYPNDIEYYMVALELTTTNGETIDYFTFPIMPDSITRPVQKRINTKQTASAITTITSDSFTPFDIQIRGNFGRAFKIILNGEPITFTALQYSRKAGKYYKNDLFKNTDTSITDEYSATVKTGYGASKILNSIIEKSDGRDSNGHFKLYFYNPAFGESYLCVPTSNPITWSQSVGDKNMIWQYSLTLKVVSFLSDINDQKEMQKKAIYTCGFSQVQKRVNNQAKSASNILLSL